MAAMKLQQMMAVSWRFLLTLKGDLRKIQIVELNPQNKTFSDSKPLQYCVAFGTLGCMFLLGTEFARTCMRVLMLTRVLVFLGGY